MGLAPARIFFNRCLAFFAILILTSLTHSLAVTPGAQPLGAAQGFNAFVIEDFTSLSSTVEGRIAVGGNLNLQHFSVGNKLDAALLHDVVLVGGNAAFPSGRIYHGNLLAGGSIAGVGSAVLYGMATGASVKGNQTLPINFATEHQYLKTLSQNIGNLPANGRVILQWGGYYLAGDCLSDLQVFSIDANQLKSVHTFAVSCIPAGATVIFNVMGASSTIQNVGLQGLASIRNKVLFNFPQATSVKFTSVGIEGSILAPLAHFENPAGNISGQLIAKSWRSTNNGYISITHHKFTGDLSAALPDNNVNSAPAITSTPELDVVAGGIFQYQVVATDPDPEDTLVFALANAPTGMTIDTVTGKVLWATSADDIGVHLTEVRVTDPEGAFDQQVFELSISAPANRIPEFLSTPIILGQENQPYIYQVEAVDPDGDGLTYSLVSAPESMVIDNTLGYISWVPLSGDIGTHNIRIRLQDSKGNGAEQSFTLTIAPGPNQPPQIISKPLTRAAAQDLYLSSIQATDPDQGDTVRFALLTAPEGMIIDAATGELRWSPSIHALGEHAIVISISDNHGLSSTHEFSLTVFKANNPPNITSLPINFALAGDDWQYTLAAEDPDGDALEFAIEESPVGAIYDAASNSVSWPTQGISPGNYAFRFSVTDADGLVVEQSFTVEILSSERRQTHEGTEFWIPISINAIRATTGGTFEINLVSRTGNTQATIAIPSLGVNQTLSLTANQISTYRINLDDVAATNAFALNEIIAGHSIHITAGLPISAYFMNQKNSTTDGFLGLPVAGLGKEYIAANYIMLGSIGISKTVDGGQTGPIITVVATEDNTEVVIDPVMDVLPGGQQHIKAHTPIVVSMNRGDIYNLETRGSFKADLTGSMIKANKPIGVYGQMECVQIPVSSTACDHIVEQLPSIDALATEYYTVPFWGRSKTGRIWYQEYGDTFRVVAPYDNTEIYINQTLRARLNKGEYFEFFGKDPQHITTNNPVLLAQYANSNQFDEGYRELPSNYTDPFMVVIPPAAQFLNSYAINTPARDMAYNFVNLLVPNSTLSTLTVDGLPVVGSLFKAIPNSNFSYAQLPISTGAHLIAAEEPFGIYVYGYDYFESYGYLGGMALSSAAKVSLLSLAGAATQSLDNQWCAESLAVDEYKRPVHGVRVQFKIADVTGKDAYQFTNARGVARYCYRANKPGVDIVTAIVGELTQTITVSWFSGTQNLPPIITSLPNLKVANGSSYSYVVLAQDPEGDALQYSLLTAPTGMSIDMAGHLVWPTIALNATRYEREKIVVQVSDSHGHKTTQSFEIGKHVPFNTSPIFENSSISSVGIVGVPFVYNTDYLQHSLSYLKYQVMADDVDEDAIFVDILSGPDEAYIQRIIAYYTGITRENDPRTCEGCLHYLRWVPQEIGEHSFELGLRDARGGISESRRFTVDVAPNLPPAIIDFNPPAVAAAGHQYSYVLNVENDLPPHRFDNLDNLRIIFEQAPNNMRSELVRIGKTQKLRIYWTPISSNAGLHTIRLRVDDQVNASVPVEFVLEVITDNKPPSIAVGNMPGAEVSIPYEYQIKATDPDGDALTYSLVGAPEGITVNKTTGVIRWIPSAEYENEQAWIRYAVTDARGLTSEKSDAISVTAFRNRAPEFVPAYRPTFAKVGVEFVHQVQAVDREGNNPLVYALSSTAVGAKIDPQNGTIRWTPTSTGRFWLSTGATDSLGNYSSSNSILWYVQVVPATELLDGEIQISPNSAVELGGTVTLTVVTKNEATSPQVTLTVDGKPVALNSLLKASITPTRAGRIPVTATISDGRETITRTTAIVVRDPADTTLPIVEFNSPSNNSDITSPTDIHVTVQDAGLTNVLLAYKAADKPAGEVVNLDEFTILYEGADEFENEVIAQLDTTLLANGLYHVFLQATDANNNTRARLLSLNVTGDLKVGNFSFTVEDLNIPVGNFPITVSRTYDSRGKTKNLDFGYGWSVDYKNIRLQESIEPTRGWSMDTSNTQVYQGSTGLFIARGVCAYPTTQQRVTVTLPDGDTESFAAAIKPTMNSPASLSDPDCYLATDRHYNVYFRPINGTQSTLETSDGASLYLSDSSNGNLGSIDDSTPVNIRRYVLTTRSGFIYRLNQDLGLEQIEDPNGNTLTYGENSIAHSNGQAVVLERDTQKRIKAIVDPKGNRIEYSYDARGDLVAVKDPESRAANGPGSTYVYDNSHSLMNMFDALGRRLVKNIYDDEGRLVAQEDNQGNRTDFDHNLTGRQSIVTDRDQRTKVFDYDTKGNVLTEIQLTSGLVYSDIIETSYTYDANNNQLTRAVGGEEYVHTATFDAKDNQLTQQDPLGNTIHYENYNPRGQEGRIVDEMGRAHDMRYNNAGQLEQIEGPEILNAEGVPVRHKATNRLNNRGLVESTTDMRGQVTTYTYYTTSDPAPTRAWLDQKKTETTAEGGITTYTYDANLNVATETRTRTIDGVVTTETLGYEYDSRNHLVKTTYPDGSSTETQFDLAGNAVREKDRYGNWTETDYDAYNRDTETRYPDGTRETKTYTAEGLPLTQRARNGTLTRYEYDDFGRQWKTHNDTAGTYTETRYTQQGWVQYEWDERRNKTEYTYDLAGRRLAVIRHGQEGVDTPVTHSFTYYPNGELETETDALGHTTRYTINALDQRIETVYHDLNTTQAGFDAMGARIRAYDQNSKATRFDYDGLGRLSGVQPEVSIEGEPVPVTRYTYDEAGNKLTQTDTKGNTTRWTYDYHGRVLSRTLPEGQQETFSYTDGKGCLPDAGATCAEAESPRLQLHTDFNGNTITSTYDVMGQVISVSYSKDGKQEVYAYTADGQVENITTSQGSITTTVSYTYTTNGQLHTETQADGTVLAYAYDDAGNRTSVSITKAGQATPTTTRYTYDGFNRLETVIDASGTTTYTYDAVGNLDTLTYPNGLVTDYGYNTVNQLTTVTTRNAENTVTSSYTYGLDATGRRDTITEHSGRFTQYTYDNLYRLTGETVTDAINGNYAASYEYDWVGNRTYETVDGVQTAYHYDNNDRLIQTGGTIYSYDNNGNTLTETLDANTKTYLWDSKNKLLSLTEGSNNTRYTYNPDGIRTGKTANGVNTHYIVDSNRNYAQVLEEVENNLTRVQYTYGHDLINQQREGTASFYHYDGLGSTRALSDSSGAFTDSYNYEAFGVIQNQTGSTDNNYLFTGEQYDSSLNQYYLRARYYDQNIGRFTQMDTWSGDPQNSITLNKYIYANSDAANGIDPSGNMTLAGQMASFSMLAILTTTAVSSFNNVMSGGNIDEDGSRGRDRKWTIWDVVAISKFRSITSSGIQVQVNADASTRRSDDGHHTIPIYLCGSRTQNLAYIDQRQHAAIHSGIAALEVALSSAEDAADRMVPFGRRRSNDVMSLAESYSGRAAISGVLETFYYGTGLWDEGTPSIGTVFPEEKQQFINGKTSLPECKRSR